VRGYRDPDTGKVKQEVIRHLGRFDSKEEAQKAAEAYRQDTADMQENQSIEATTESPQTHDVSFYAPPIVEDYDRYRLR
jgi:hypothetical protein